MQLDQYLTYASLMQNRVIKNHISKEEKYTFALNELSDYIGQKNIKKIEAYDVVIFLVKM